MGVGRREFVCFLCDGCGREIIAEEGTRIDGFYLEALHVTNGEQVSDDNIYACSEMCVERAVRDALKRSLMPQEQKLTATQELWLRGRRFVTNPGIPIVDVGDETRQIGTAHELRPSPEPRTYP